MSEAARRGWGPATAERGPSTEYSLEPIALEARLVEARARRTRALAVESGSPAAIPPLAPNGRAFPRILPTLLAGLSAGVIAAALGLFWIIDPFAALTKIASPPQAVTVPPAGPAQPADLLAGLLPPATGAFPLGAPATAPFAPTDVPQAPALSAPSREAIDAVLVDGALRQLSPVLAPLLPAVVAQPLLPFMREPANPAPTALPVSDVPLAARAALGRAAIWPVSATIPSFAAVPRAAARELPAAAREFPLSDDGPSYEPQMLCDAVSCYYARPTYSPAAKPAAALPAVKAVTVPVARPPRQPRASAPSTQAAKLSDAPASSSLGEVHARPAAPLTQRAVAGADHRGLTKGPSAAKVPTGVKPSNAAAQQSTQPTGSLSRKATSRGESGENAGSQRSQGQRASKSGTGEHAARATGQARRASAISGSKASRSLSSATSGRGAGAEGPKNSSDGASRSNSGHGGSHAKSGKGGSPSGASKSGGGSKSGSGGKGGKGNGKDKGNGNGSGSGKEGGRH